jgi:hypothetical protein
VSEHKIAVFGGVSPRSGGPGKPLGDAWPMLGIALRQTSRQGIFRSPRTTITLGNVLEIL